MKSFTISLSHEYIQQEVTIQGWIYNIRSSGKILFVILRDGTGFIQCIVMKNTIGEELFEKIKHLSQESSVVFTGIIKEDHRSPWGYEMEVSSADIIQSVQDEYPIQLKDHGVGFLSNYRHLWVRTPTQRSILKIRAEVIQSIRDFLNQNGSFPF